MNRLIEHFILFMLLAITAGFFLGAALTEPGALTRDPARIAIFFVMAVGVLTLAASTTKLVRRGSRKTAEFWVVAMACAFWAFGLCVVSVLILVTMRAFGYDGIGGEVIMYGFISASAVALFVAALSLLYAMRTRQIRREIVYSPFRALKRMFWGG